jgi:hypothetical protein
VVTRPKALPWAGFETRRWRSKIVPGSSGRIDAKNEYIKYAQLHYVRFNQYYLTRFFDRGMIIKIT